MNHNERVLRQLAARAGYRSIYAVARASGVARHTIVAALRGRRRPTRSTIAKLAACLSVPEGIVAEVLAGGRPS